MGIFQKIKDLFGKNEALITEIIRNHKTLVVEHFNSNHPDDISRVQLFEQRIRSLSGDELIALSTMEGEAFLTELNRLYNKEGWYEEHVVKLALRHRKTGRM